LKSGKIEGDFVRRRKIEYVTKMLSSSGDTVSKYFYYRGVLQHTDFRFIDGLSGG
jgi:hypothetical protein